MEKVCEELDEVKAANEKLRGNFRAKTKLLENLKKLQNKQLIEIQEARSVIEKQGYESEETLMREEKDYYEEDSSEKEEPFDGPWSRKVKDGSLRRTKVPVIQVMLLIQVWSFLGSGSRSLRL